MSNNNNGSGGYFGSFSSGGGPRNLTSDMWAPIISADNNYIANTSPAPKSANSQNKAPSENTSANKKTEQTRESKASQKRDTSQKKKKNGKRFEKKSKSQPSVKTQDTISQAVPKERDTQKGTDRKITIPLSEKDKQRIIKLRKKQAKKRLRDKDRYSSLIKSGKSIDEARRIMSKRKVAKRKFGTFLSVLCAFIFASCICWTYCYFEGAPIKDINIKGDEVYTREEIISAVGVLPGQSMLTVREDDVNEKVHSKLPFISSISLNYIFPETLEMEIISTRERFIIKNGNKYICVDKNGKIVSLKKKKVEKEQFLIIGPTFENPEIGAKFQPLQVEITDGMSDDEKAKFEKKNDFEVAKYNAMMEISALCEKYGVITNGKIDLSDLSDIKIDYQSRVRIYLGDLKNMEIKIKTASDIITQQVGKEQTGYVDVSYDVRNFFLPGTMER